MIKYVTRPLKKKDYNRVISLIKKTRKILTILGLIGILWANGPMQYLNAMDNQPIYTEQVVYNNDTLLPTYPSTTDIDFNSMDVEIESEIDEYRTLTSKTFQKKDGSLELAMYEEIIHYELDGELLDIDNR